MGEYLRGYEKLEPLVLDTMIAFPDIKLHIVDTFCEGNDIDGYKTTMPVIHTATHLGWHSVSLYSQLGVSPPEEKWSMPTDDCNQLFDWDTGYINPKLVPTEIGNDA